MRVYDWQLFFKLLAADCIERSLQQSSNPEKLFKIALTRHAIASVQFYIVLIYSYSAVTLHVLVVQLLVPILLTVV